MSAVTTLAYSGFLVGPALVGLLAGATSLATALALMPVLSVVLAVAAGFAPVPRRG